MVWKDGAMWTSGKQQRGAWETGAVRREDREGCDGWDVLTLDSLGEFFPFQDSGEAVNHNI